MSIRNRVVQIAVVTSVSGAAIAASAADLPGPPPTGAAMLSGPEPFFIRVGGTAVVTDSSITARIAGSPVAGGGGTVGDEPAAYVEGGYFLTRNVAASLSLGYPPTFTARGTGSLAPFGTLYEAQVGLPVLQVTYHLDPIWRLRPYAGVGAGYAVVFDEAAGALLAPKLRNSPAFVLVGGVDYDLSENWGIFVDVKKAFLTQNTTGLTQAFPGLPAILPVSARVRTDPILASTGIAYRF